MISEIIMFHRNLISFIDNSFLGQYINGFGTLLGQERLLGLCCVDRLNVTNSNFTYSFLNAVSKKSNCAYEVPTAIDLASIWKTWISDLTESVFDTLSKINLYSPTNIFINGNSFNGFPVLLRLSNPINLTHDLSNYWLRSFATPNYLMPRQDYYISNSVNNLTTTFAFVNNDPVVLSDLLGVGYPGYSTISNKVFLKVYQTYLYFYNNFSITGVNIPIQVNTTVFNQSNALISKSDGSASICNGDCNITLNPLNSSCVFNNANLTEGLTRGDSTCPFPIYFTSSTSNLKTIKNNLSNSVNMTTYLTTLNCNTLGSITYNNINYTQTSGWFYSGNTYTCEDNIVTLNNIEITSGDSIIYLSYNADSLSACNTSLNAFISYIALLGLLGTIIFFGWLLAYMFGMVDKQTFKNVNIVGSITILILLGVLLIVAIFIFSSLCSTF